MVVKPSVQHTYLHFGARHKLDFVGSKKFGENISLRRISKRHLRGLVGRIFPEGANSYWLTDENTDHLECLYLRSDPPRAIDDKPSFFDTHLSQQQSSLPDELAACVAAIDIAQPLFFSSDFLVGYRTTPDGVRLHNYAGQSFRTSLAMWTAVYEADGNFVSEDIWKQAKAIYSGMECISRTSHPRLHQAVRFHARAMREDFFDYCYLNEFLVLESLFNTAPQEIMHKMAERAAIVASDADHGTTYRQVKEVALFRNQVAHGFRKTKGRKATASAMLKQMAQQNRTLLARILTTPQLRDIWKTTKDDQLEARLLDLTLAQGSNP